jgi:C4-dicarboxylate-binding protein DctP
MRRFVMSGGLAAFACSFALAFAGCSLGGGATKVGSAKPGAAAVGGTVVVRYATAGAGPAEAQFLRQLAAVSGGRVRVQVVPYDRYATDVDQRLAHDVAAGRIDVADVGARAWESLGVTGFRAFQAPFLISSDALLDAAIGEPRIVAPLLGSLAAVHVTGLAVVPWGLRYLFSARRALASPQAFRGARIRINQSPTTADILRALGAQPTSAIRSGPPVAAALRAGRLDAVESDLRTAVTNGYVAAAPHLSPALFAKVTTIVASTARMRALGPTVAAWISTAARRTAAAQRHADERLAWAAACGGGLQPSHPTPAQMDTLQVAELEPHTGLDGDLDASLSIDRIGLLAARAPARDAWARCGRPAREPSATDVLDGAYEMRATEADVVRDGGVAGDGNAGPYRLEVGHGRYTILHMGGADPAWPKWDFARDPVEVGTVVLRGRTALFRPETALRVGSLPARLRFELFRGRIRWTLVDTDPAAAGVVMNMVRLWRKTG